MQENMLKLCRCRQIPVQEDKLLLKSMDKSLVLTGEHIHKVAEKLMPHLNGTCTCEELSDKIPEDMWEGAEKMLRLMEREGFFQSAEADVQKELAQCSVLLIGSGRLAAKIEENLRESGAGHLTTMDSYLSYTYEEMCEQLRDTDMAVVCTDTPRPDICTLVNKAALATECPWLLVQVDGRDGWVGPLFLPKETGCYSCFMQRVFSDSFHPEIDRAVHEHALEDPAQDLLGFLPPFQDMTAATASLEIIRHLTGISAPLTYKAQILTDCITGISRRDVLHRIPRCADCSEIGEEVSCIQAFSG
jgi:ribosomal protein S12 methylthiotransferase accessory factor